MIIIPGMAPRVRLALLLVFLVAFGVASIACSALPGLRPTATPSPTNTPAPTSTPPPPTATPAPEALLRVAERAFEYGEWDEAASAARAVEAFLPATLAESARILAARSLVAQSKPADAIAVLETAEFQEATNQARALSVLATAYRDAGDWQKAIDAQTALLSATEVLTGWIHELNGDVRVQLGSISAAVESYRLAASAAETNGQIRLLEKAAGVYADAAQAEEALKTYDDILALSNSPETSAKIHYLKGIALRQQKREADALGEFHKAVEASTVARESYLSLVELVNAGETVDEFRRGLIGYQNGAYQPAIQAFARYLGSEGSDRMADAWYYTGMAYFALGERDEALAALDKAVAAAPDDAFRTKVLMVEARVLRQAERLSDARAAYAQVWSICPQCSAAPQALWLSAEAAFDQGDRAGAASDFIRLQRNYPHDSGADDAMLRAALLYYADGRYSETVAACEDILSRYPDSPLSAAAHFWAAKASLQAGKQVSAASHLAAAAASASPDYYSLRASAVLRGDTTILPPAGNLLLASDTAAERQECLAWLMTWANNGEVYDFDQPSEGLANDADYRRGEAFASLNLPVEAVEAFALARARWKDAPLALFYLAERLRDLGLHRQSIACAERVIALSPTGTLAESPRYLQRLAFPVPYADLVLEQASLNKVDALLVFAVMRQESRFDPIAGSWAGAMGLMQVIPPTGEWVALQLGIRDFQQGDLLRPAVNVRFGTWYLGRQMRDFSGDPLAALAAYNGGPGYARAWLARLEDYDPDLFVESIPVAETQTYVKAILEQYAVYRQLYQPGRTAP